MTDALPSGVHVHVQRDVCEPHDGLHVFQVDLTVDQLPAGPVLSDLHGRCSLEAGRPGQLQHVLCFTTDDSYASGVEFLESLRRHIGQQPDNVVVACHSHGKRAEFVRGYDTRQGGRTALTRAPALQWLPDVFRLFRSSLAVTQQHPVAGSASVTVLWEGQGRFTQLSSPSWRVLQQELASDALAGLTPSTAGHEICFLDQPQHPRPWEQASTALTPDNDADFYDDWQQALDWLATDCPWPRHAQRRVHTLLRDKPHPGLLLAVQFCQASGWCLRPMPSVMGELQTRYGKPARVPAAPAPPLELDLCLAWSTAEVPCFAMDDEQPGALRQASDPTGTYALRARFTATAPGTSRLFLMGPGELRIVPARATDTGLPVTVQETTQTCTAALRRLHQTMLPSLGVTPVTTASHGEALLAWHRLQQDFQQEDGNPLLHPLVQAQCAYTGRVLQQHHHALVQVPSVAPTTTTSSAPKRRRLSRHNTELYPGAALESVPSLGPATFWE